MSHDKMPEMGDAVNVGLAPVKVDKYYLGFDYFDSEAECVTESYPDLTLPQVLEKIVAVMKEHSEVDLTIKKEN